MIWDKVPPHLLDEINKNCSLISKSFMNISNFFSQIYRLPPNKKFEKKREDLPKENFHYRKTPEKIQNGLTKRESTLQKTDKGKYSPYESQDSVKPDANITINYQRTKRLRNPYTIKKNSKVLKGIGFGRIISVHCYDKDVKTRGYKIHIKYYKSNFLIGPFKDYAFACNLNKTIQEELKLLHCTKTNYKEKVQYEMERIKNQIYKEIQPLSLTPIYPNTIEEEKRDN